MSESIKEVRKRLGFTMPQITAALGIPVRTQQDWEAGRRSPSPWLEAMVIREYEWIAKEKESKQ